MRDVEPHPETPVLLPQELHDFLVRVAEERGVAVGDLIRSAVEARYEARESATAYDKFDQVEREGGWKFATFDAPLW